MSERSALDMTPAQLMPAVELARAERDALADLCRRLGSDEHRIEQVLAVVRRDHFTREPDHAASEAR